LEKTIKFLKNLDSSKLGAIKSIKKLFGGTVNQTYKITSINGEFVIRVNTIDQINVFKKEIYCYEVANKLGIPSPEVIDLYENSIYCVLTTKYIPGLSDKEIIEDKRSLVWRKLGEYSQLISQIKELPYDEDAENVSDAKSHYLNKMLSYSIKEFSNSNDYFVKNNLFNKSEVRRVINLLNTLKSKLANVDFGLIHGDLSLSNVVLSDDGGVYLIDWGCAKLSPVPDFPVMELYLQSILKESFQEKYIFEFLKGYGLDNNNIDKTRERLNAMSLLNYTDKIRWAVDNDKKEALKKYKKKLEKTKHQLLII
jgi:tRNA A-37 threonylcarbamoyl transferase component Bud32